MARRKTTERRRKMPPVHPGRLLRDEIFPALDLTVKGAAERLGVSRQTLHRILAERAPISPEMALKIGRLVGNGPALWMNMQSRHDLWTAERRIRDQLAAIEPMAA
jgi:addiction module HigA family antidote